MQQEPSKERLQVLRRSLIWAQEEHDYASVTEGDIAWLLGVSDYWMKVWSMRWNCVPWTLCLWRLKKNLFVLWEASEWWQSEE